MKVRITLLLLMTWILKYIIFEWKVIIVKIIFRFKRLAINIKFLALSTIVVVIIIISIRHSWELGSVETIAKKIQRLKISTTPKISTFWWIFASVPQIKSKVQNAMTVNEGHSYFVPKTHPNSCFSGPKPPQKRGGINCPQSILGLFLSGENPPSARCAIRIVGSQSKIITKK